jgi:hypothetical protein
MYSTRTYSFKQCCGTVMIYCGYDSGSESYFGKVLVSGPASVPVPVPYPDLLSTVFKQHFFYKSYLCNAKSDIVSQKDPVPEPEPGLVLEP